MKNLKVSIWCFLILSLITACNFNRDDKSPTATLKTFLTASEKKEANLMKQTLSKSSIKALEDSGKSNKSSIDEILKNQAFLSTFSDLPELREEKIEGENATLEFKNPSTQTWQKIFFVNEDKQWKIVLDRFVAETLKK